MSEITQTLLDSFEQELRQQERSPGTIQKYRRDVSAFAAWLGEEALDREAAAGWKLALLEAGHAPATVNSMLSALNGFLRHIGREDCRVRFLKIQRRLFRDSARELSRAEYERLVAAASGAGRERLALLMETICATGIRVSELRYVTVEAAEHRRTDISLKGKIRTVLLPGKLCRKLLKYAKRRKITSGAIFRTGSGRALGRRQIWAEMKSLCVRADVAPGKVFPHNLRHLFARAFYAVCRDVVRLADVLGHSSIETTRLYLLTSGEEHARTLERMRLIL